jgi:hypothetical protein
MAVMAAAVGIMKVVARVVVVVVVVVVAKARADASALLNRLDSRSNKRRIICRSRLAGELGVSAAEMSTDPPRSPASRLLRVIR